MLSQRTRGSSALFAVAVLVGVPLAGCLESGPGPSDSNTPYVGDETYRIIASGWSSGIHTNRTVTVTTQAEWESLWNEHATMIPPDPAPAVDFATERVLAIFMGDQPNPGWSVNLTALTTDEGNKATVATAAVMPPDPAADYAAVIAQPYVMAAFMNRDTTVRVEWTALERPGGGGSGTGASDEEPGSEGVPEETRTVAQGWNSAITDRQFRVVANESEWQALWQEHSNMIPPGDPPEVDFETERVIAVFLGSKPNPGWGVNVTAVATHVDAAKTIAHAMIHEPDPDGIYPAVVAQPFHMVAVAKRGTTVEVTWSDSAA